MDETYVLCAAAAAVLAVMAVPAPSEACSIACIDARTTPADGGTIPSNFGPMTVRSSLAEDIEKADVELEFRNDAEAPWEAEPFTLESGEEWNSLSVRPEEGWRPGTTYRLRMPDCEEEPLEVTFSTTEEAPLPESIGELEVVDRRIDSLEVSNSASCSAELPARQIRVRVDLTDDAEPWSDVIHFRTFVDGDTWEPTRSVGSWPAPGASWKGRGEDVVHTFCSDEKLESTPELEPGRHTVSMEASIATSDESSDPVTLQTNELDVVLSCNPEKNGSASSGKGAGPRGCSSPRNTGSPAPGSALFTLWALVVIGRLRR